jgi:hypothetical protein
MKESVKILIEDCERAGFHGDVLIKFEAGNAVKGEVKKTVKL